LKILLDFNLSPKLLAAIAGLFPGSAHVQGVGFRGETPDELIWQFAAREGFTLLTSDRDFLELAARFGHPPKVVTK
jgi:predicted nuclease of predicted toxin-antitoxin system